MQFGIQIVLFKNMNLSHFPASLKQTNQTTVTGISCFALDMKDRHYRIRILRHPLL